MLLVICAVTLFALLKGDAAAYPSSEAGLMMKRALLLGYVIGAAGYFAIFESSGMQASLGKRLVGIKVVDSDGNRLSFFRALCRWLATGLSWLSLGVGLLMSAFAGKRALHDFATRTQVVDQWAFSPTPERQHVATYGQLVVGFGTLAMVLFGFLASSQYSDYVLRSQVSEGPALADSMQSLMETHFRAHGSWPASNAKVGLGKVSGTYVGSIDIGKVPGRIEITFSSITPQRANPKLGGRRLFIDGQLTNGEIAWNCHSPDLRQADCPSRCNCSW